MNPLILDLKIKGFIVYFCFLIFLFGCACEKGCAPPTGQQKRPTKMQSIVLKQQMLRASNRHQKASKSMQRVGYGRPNCLADCSHLVQEDTEQRAKNRTRAGRPKRTQEKEKKNTRASRSEQNEHEQRQQEHKPAGLSRTMLSPRAEQEQQKHNN